MGKVSNKIKEMMKEETEKLFKKDEEFEEPRFLESPTKRDAEERVIDELLASVPKQQGYYLKLSKEIRPNEYELKLRIDDYDAWSDLEWEVTNIVRAYTLKQPVKWGSGHYRLIIWREGGIRGPKFKPLDFFIDAQELDTTVSNVSTNSHTSMQEQLDGVSGLVRTLKDIIPTTSPSEVNKQLSESFNAGISIKAQSDANQASTTNVMISSLVDLVKSNQQANINNMGPKVDDSGRMQMEMMKMMIESFRDTIREMKEINKNQPIAQDPLDLLVKLKAAGLIPDRNQETSGVKQTLELISTLTPIMQSMSGAGETSITTELIRTLGPQLGKIIGDVTSSINSAVALKRSMSPTEIPYRNNPVSPEERYGPTEERSNKIEEQYGTINKQNGQVPIVPQENGDMWLQKFLVDLNIAINKNDSDFYPQLDDLMTKLTTKENYEYIMSRQISIDTVINQVRPFAGDFITTPRAKQYFESYIDWVNIDKTNIGKVDIEVVGVCNNCNIEYGFKDLDEMQKFSRCEECGIGTIIEQTKV